MNILRTVTLACLLFLLPQIAAAQAGNPAQADTMSLKGQFDAMLDASNRFQKFKVVRQDFLLSFIDNVGDSITDYTNEIGNLKATIGDQETKIEEQAGEINVRDEKITALSGEKDSVNLLGLPLSKATYNVVMWSAILALLAALLFAIARMRLAVSDSREARVANEKVTAELDKSRKNRLEVEQKLRRQLQDERNKYNG